MIKRVHQLIWSNRNEDEHKAVMAECDRAVALGGSFEIVNEYTTNWYSRITIYYPEKEAAHGITGEQK